MDYFAHHPPIARWAHILLRMVAGLMIAQHGAQKLFGVFGGYGHPGATTPLLSVMGLVGVLEFVGGILLVIGLFTRLVAFILSGELAVAYFWVHASRALWPILNRGELAALYAFVFLYLAATGAGAFSVDYVLARRSPRPVMAP